MINMKDLIKQQGDMIRKESGMNITEGFKPTVVLAKYSGGGKYKPFKQEHFKTEDEAKKFIKDMIKKYKLNRQKGFWANPKTGVELVTNF